MLSIAYLGLIIFIIFLELTRKKDNKFDFLSLFHLFFTLLYPLPGYFLVNLTIDNSQMANLDVYGLTTYELQHSWQVPVAIYLTYFLFLLGYYSHSAHKYGSMVIITSKSNKVLWRITLGILLLGVISMYIYSTQYGGLVKAITQGNLIRSQAVEGQALGFFVRLLYFNFFATYLIASWLFIKKNQYHKNKLWALFIFAVAVSTMAAFMVNARGTMILAFVNFYLAYLLCKRKLALPVLIPLLGVIAIFIIYGKIFFFSLSGLSEGGYLEAMSRFREATTESTGDRDALSSLIKVFNYGFISLYTAFKQHYPLRLLSDWLYGFGSFLPDHLIEVDIKPNVSSDNSIYMLGHDDYTIPAGFIAGCVYSWSWPGVIIYSFCYGWIGRYLQTILQRHLHKIFWIPFVYVAIAQAWADFLSYGDPQIFLQTNFWILVSVGFLFFFGVKISVSKRKNNLVNEKI